LGTILFTTSLAKVSLSPRLTKQPHKSNILA
jgi:hypothetical protein